MKYCGLNETLVKKQIVMVGALQQMQMPVFKPLVNRLFIMMNDIWKEEWLDREPVLGNMANINPWWI